MILAELGVVDLHEAALPLLKVDTYCVVQLVVLKRAQQVAADT